MSAGDKTTYLYEPLFQVTLNGTEIEDMEDVDGRNDLVREYLRDLFECEISYDKRPNEQKDIEGCKMNKAQ